MVKKKNIGTLLREYGLIGDLDLQEGLKLQNETGLRLGEALVRLGKVTAEDIDWILSKQLDIPFVIVDDLCMDKELAERFPRDFLIKNRILPVYENDEEMAVITDDPFNQEAFEILEEMAQKKLKLSSGSGRGIEGILKRSLRKEGVPSLISRLESVVGKIGKSAFYRIDFLLSRRRGEVRVFGSGVLRPAFVLDDGLVKEDIFHAFDGIGVPFLYDEYSNESSTFLSVIPLSGPSLSGRVPAIAGSYGLLLPETTAFTDMRVYGLQHLFHSPSPVPGYTYIATRRGVSDHKQVIYTVDSAPEDFRDYYVKAHIPEECGSCGGGGCERCDGLGYRFREINGVYSSVDLRGLLRRD